MFTPTTNRRRYAVRGPRGFTLIEMLLALGLMAVALSTSLAMFVVGLRSQTVSVKDTLGSIICRNAQAVVLTRLKHDTTTKTIAGFPAGGVSTTDLTDVTGQFGGAETCYPFGDAGTLTNASAADLSFTDNTKNWQPDQWKGMYFTTPGNKLYRITSNTLNTLILEPLDPQRPFTSTPSMGSTYQITSLRGFLVLAKQVVANANDYALVFIAYELEDPDYKPYMKQNLPVTLYGAAVTVPKAQAVLYPLGTPLLYSGTGVGAYATVINKVATSSTTTTVMLDHYLSVSGANPLTLPRTFVQSQVGINGPFAPRSPAMSVLTMRTSLREN